jgi:hypothetical protein
MCEKNHEALVSSRDSYQTSWEMRFLGLTSIQFSTGVLECGFVTEINAHVWTATHCGL